MDRLTNRQRIGLEALCSLVAPAVPDLAPAVANRVFDLPPYHLRRALLSLSLFSISPLRPLLIRHRAFFNSVRRLILHTHHSSKPPAASRFPWEGPLPDASPVVATQSRQPVHQRIVHAGVTERLSHDTELSCEFCVIGSGVGGAMAAAVLAEAGRDVVILEEGEYHTSADFSDDESRALRTLYADAGLRSTDDMSVSILQARCAGGGSTVNWMVMLRTPDRVLDEWRRQHASEVSNAEMQDAFARFERESNVANVADHAHSPINRLILDASAKLGWRAQGAAVNARDCMRVGSCGLGCKYDAKQTALRIYLEHARLYCNTHVDRIQRGVVSATSNGKKLTVRCEKIIVAAGAVGTPVLLQRSGLGNDQVGAHLRLHPTTAVVGIYDRQFYARTGIPLTTYCDEFAELRNGYGHWIEAPPLTSGLAAIAMPGYGQAHTELMNQFPNLAPLIVLVRDGEPSGPSVGRVSAKRNYVSIRYRLGDGDRSILNHGIASATRMHEVSGAQRIVTLHTNDAKQDDPALFSAHVNGTCRFGGNASSSACTPDGALRGERDIYVIDGSLLPTAPGVNPHETIAAVTMILTQRLAAF